MVLLVFWVQGCQNDAKTDAYKDYMRNAAAIARASNGIGANLKNLVVTPGIKQAELSRSSTGSPTRSSRTSTARTTLDPPGHLREAHKQLIEALQFRVSGVRGLADAFASTSKNTDADKAGTALAEQAKRLLASDVVWDDTFRTPATQDPQRAGHQGRRRAAVAVRRATSTSSAPATFSAMFKRMNGAATPTGTSGGLHGTGIVSTTALPQDSSLVRRRATTRSSPPRSSRSRSRCRTPETASRARSPVTLTIQKQGAPIKQTQTIDVINPGETKKVVFKNIDTTGVFGVRTTLKVDVQPVPPRRGSRTTASSTP